MEMEMTKTSFITKDRAFWAHVYILYLVGLCTIIVGSNILYKEFWLDRKTILIGQVDTYDDGSIDERVEFRRGKGK